MSDPSDRPGMFLPGMSWFSEVEAEGRLISRERKAWRQAAKIENHETPCALGVSRRERARGSSRSFSAFWPEQPGSYPSVLPHTGPRQRAGSNHPVCLED